MFKSAPFLGQVNLRPPSMGCGGGFIPAPAESDGEEPKMMGCDKHRGHYVIGCSKCKMRRKPDSTLESQPPSRMVGTYPTIRHVFMAGRYLGQTKSSTPQAVCLVNAPVTTPDMNCQRTSTGDIICSDGVIHSGTCPYAPAVNYPGVAEDMNVGGTQIPKTPPSGSGGVAIPSPIPGGTTAPAPSAPSSVLPVVGLVGGGALILGLGYLLFK